MQSPDDGYWLPVTTVASFHVMTMKNGKKDKRERAFNALKMYSFVSASVNAHWIMKFHCDDICLIIIIHAIKEFYLFPNHKVLINDSLTTLL